MEHQALSRCALFADMHEGELSASRIATMLSERFDYSKTTTYTLIQRCIDKGAVERLDPGFRCRALVSREWVQEFRTDELVNKMFDGACDRLIASIIGRRKLAADEGERLKKMIIAWSNKP